MEILLVIPENLMKNLKKNFSMIPEYVEKLNYIFELITNQSNEPINRLRLLNKIK